MRSKTPQAYSIRYAIVALCLLVLLFAVDVKVSQYRDGASQQPDPVSSAKLWLNGQKLEMPAVIPFTSMMCLAILLFAPLLPVSPERRPLVAITEAPRGVSMRALRRFQRPPPSV